MDKLLFILFSKCFSIHFTTYISPNIHYSKGFVTKTVLNGTAGEVLDALLLIGRSRTPGDLLVFYFSGHGMEVCHLRLSIAC